MTKRTMKDRILDWLCRRGIHWCKKFDKYILDGSELFYTKGEVCVRCSYVIVKEQRKATAQERKLYANALYGVRGMTEEQFAEGVEIVRDGAERLIKKITGDESAKVVLEPITPSGEGARKGCRYCLQILSGKPMAGYMIKNRGGMYATYCDGCPHLSKGILQPEDYNDPYGEKKQPQTTGDNWTHGEPDPKGDMTKMFKQALPIHREALLDGVDPNRKVWSEEERTEILEAPAPKPDLIPMPIIVTKQHKEWLEKVEASKLCKHWWGICGEESMRGKPMEEVSVCGGLLAKCTNPKYQVEKPVKEIDNMRLEGVSLMPDGSVQPQISFNDLANEDGDV